MTKEQEDKFIWIDAKKELPILNIPVLCRLKKPKYDVHCAALFDIDWVHEDWDYDTLTRNKVWTLNRQNSDEIIEWCYMYKDGKLLKK